MDKNKIFIFDLDGTITEEESLPKLAAAISKELSVNINSLTQQTLAGKMLFEASFRRRVDMLKELPLSTAKEVMSKINLNSYIADFIWENRKNCIIVTCNLDVWIAPIAEKLGCNYFSSEAIIQKDRIIDIKKVLNKENTMQFLKSKYSNTVGIGDSRNDIPLLKYSDIGIAYSGVNPLHPELQLYADYTAENGKSLVNILVNL